jgi:hypothetical protein
MKSRLWFLKTVTVAAPNNKISFKFVFFFFKYNATCKSSCKSTSYFTKRSGYNVPGMLDLKGALLLDGSKDMSIRVSTCTSYDLNSLKAAVWKLWR